jgi:CheY-like chemotaxis protein
MTLLDKMINTAIAYDCVLLDVDMPEKDGIQLCAEIRAQPRYANTPIIMVTKHSDHDAVERAFINGATDYISKPFQFFEVLTRIKLAERLVLERQAAIDSYVATQKSAPKRPRLSVVPASQKDSGVSGVPMQEISNENILTLSVFQNYLEKAACAENCKAHLMAIKIHKIDEIFENTTALEFVEFLKMVAEAVKQEFEPNNVFMTHFGNGIFLCAGNTRPPQEIAEIQRSVVNRLLLRNLPDVCRSRVPVMIIWGMPVLLKTTMNLNFNRASKAAIARMEQCETLASNAAMSSVDSVGGVETPSRRYRNTRRW